MIRLGLRLALRTGRQAVTRLLVTAAAVGVGVSLLLSMLAMFHAYEATVHRACWECTQPAAPGSVGGGAPLLWNRHDDVYRGKPLLRVDVAALTSTSGLRAIPGLDHLPGPGEYVASPALARLLSSIPADQLADRFPGHLAGRLAPAVLGSPDDLAIVVGFTPRELSARPGTSHVAVSNTAPRSFGSTVIYQFGFALGTVALLVPLLVLIGTATRLAAARREERFAAMRLVGATSPQVTLLASIEAVLAALLGTVAGIGGYQALRPALTGLPLLGSRFYQPLITPTAAGYVAALIVVPAGAAAAALISLRRVRLSPLGVTRRATPPPPRAWRLLPLAIGVPLFVVPLVLTSRGGEPPTVLAVLAFTMVLTGIVIAGPWLTVRAARLLGRHLFGGATLLASRRLADDPRAAFRSVSGLVLAVMVGTTLAATVPTVLQAQRADAATLQNVVRVGFDSVPPPCTQPCDPAQLSSPQGLSSGTSATLLGRLTAMSGVRAIPLYRGRDGYLITCDDLRALPALGSCPARTRVVIEEPWHLFVDNISAVTDNLPLVTAATPRTTERSAGKELAMLIITTSGDRATLERVRTLLSTYTTSVDEAHAPKTFGEVTEVRATLYQQANRAVVILAALTLLIAGCALAVSVTGSLLERKRPFTLLRLTGSPTSTLHRVVLLETLLPLTGAAGLAVGVGLVLAYPIAHILAPNHHGFPLPGPDYLLILSAGMVAALAAVGACLPVLSRITHPDTARFE